MARGAGLSWIDTTDLILKVRSGRKSCDSVVTYWLVLADVDPTPTLATASTTTTLTTTSLSQPNEQTQTLVLY